MKSPCSPNNRSIRKISNRCFTGCRQRAASQLWFAAGARAWHYNWDAATSSWRDPKEGGELFDNLRTQVKTKLEA